VKIQKLLWPILVSRLIIDILIITYGCFSFYWYPSEVSFDWFFTRLLWMTSLNIVYMARSIYKLEHQILNNLYQDECLRCLRSPKVMRNSQMIKVSVYRSFILFLTYNFFDFLVGTVGFETMYSQ